MKYVALVLAYLVGAFLTGGYYANHRCEVGPYTRGPCAVETFYLGGFWPAYWAGRGALWVTR
jgi:hypothetical protein